MTIVQARPTAHRRRARVLKGIETRRTPRRSSERVIRILWVILCFGIVVAMNACADASLTESGLLANYLDLRSSDGILTKSRFRVNKERLGLASTVSIVPTRLSEQASGSGLSPEQLNFVGNTIDRALCAGLSARYHIVGPAEPADMKVQAFVTSLTPTNVAAAGVSSAIGIGGTVASAATGLPVRVPRLPIGMGGLSVEGQAVDAGGQQLAAFVWARGADAITTRPRASEEADAYGLASEFGADFARLLVTGDDPIKAMPQLPDARDVGEFLGASPRQVACAEYGRNPGIAGLLGGVVGIPPSWTDKGRGKQ